MKSSKVKGNILDTWHRRTLTVWELCKGEFPHKDIKLKYRPGFWEPDEESFNLSMECNTSVQAIAECRYYYLEDWLASRCTGYFLLIADNKSKSYNIYFEEEKDLTFFNLSW